MSRLGKLPTGRVRCSADHSSLFAPGEWDVGTQKMGEAQAVEEAKVAAEKANAWYLIYKQSV